MKIGSKVIVKIQIHPMMNTLTADGKERREYTEGIIAREAKGFNGYIYQIEGDKETWYPADQVFELQKTKD